MNSKIKYLVYGLGKSGNAAIELLQLQGISRSEILGFEDSMNESILDPVFAQVETGELILSPGVPMAHPRVQNLLQRGWKLSSEINLACAHLKQEKVIGITGSVGKSTVTSLIGAAAQKIDRNVFVGGNLGTPFAQYAIDILRGRPRAQWIILELSSYQLENCPLLSLEHAMITYLAPNHLERYQSLEHYYDTKFLICGKTKGSVFVNSKSHDLIQRLNRVQIHGKHPNWVPTNFDDRALLDLANQKKLWGEHNLENVMQALTLSQKLNWGPQADNAIVEFSGLPHRLQYVGPFGGVHFLNDSKATAIDSVRVALKACVEKREPSATVWLLLGGRDKKLPWEQLRVLKADTAAQNEALANYNHTKATAPTDESHALHVIFFGECAEVAQTKSELPGERFERLKEALEFVFSKVQPKDIVLLSPGGTSLDEFKNFEERGAFFISMIHQRFLTKPL